MEERQALDAMLEIMREHDLDALTVRSGEQTFELVRRAEAASGTYVPLEAPAQGSAPAVAPGAAANYKKVSAPIIGVFYNAPAPGAQVGDRVEVGQVLCILEAMKLMNEITSDYSGVVRRILPENGTLVSLGDEMFWIEP
jgi:biotin carboxyl carrier protein